MPDFNSNLGLQQGSDGSSIEMETRAEHEVSVGTIHFAVLATLAEVSAAQVVAASVVPASLHLHLLSRAKPGRLVARGRLIRRGRRLAVAEGEVFQQDRLVAKATVMFALI